MKNIAVTFYVAIDGRGDICNAPNGEYTGIILGMDSANERRRYIVTSSLIGWVHTQNDPCYMTNVKVHSCPSYPADIFYRLVLHARVAN